MTNEMVSVKREYLERLIVNSNGYLNGLRLEAKSLLYRAEDHFLGKKFDSAKEWLGHYNSRINLLKKQGDGKMDISDLEETAKNLSEELNEIGEKL